MADRGGQTSIEAKGLGHRSSKDNVQVKSWALLFFHEFIQVFVVTWRSASAIFSLHRPCAAVQECGDVLEVRCSRTPSSGAKRWRSAAAAAAGRAVGVSRCSLKHGCDFTYLAQGDSQAGGPAVVQVHARVVLQRLGLSHHAAPAR